MFVSVFITNIKRCKGGDQVWLRNDFITISILCNTALVWHGSLISVGGRGISKVVFLVSVAVVLWLQVEGGSGMPVVSKGIRLSPGTCLDSVLLHVSTLGVPCG